MRGVRDEAESIGLDCKKFLLASLRNSTGFGREAVGMRHWSLGMRKPRVGQSGLVASRSEEHTSELQSP